MGPWDELLDIKVHGAPQISTSPVIQNNKPKEIKRKLKV